MVSSYLTEALWAKGWPELQKACFFGRICCFREPIRFKLFEVEGCQVIQCGPTCGLVAMNMLFKNKLIIDQVLQDAINLNYTLNGEMFSAVNLMNLLKKYLPVVIQEDHKVDIYLFEGELNCERITKELTDGSMLLVPYDADVNHGPGLFNGHKAHWALIVGYILDQQNEYYVLARHGKSKNLAAWQLKQLSASNSNLCEFAKPKKHKEKEFILPFGGIAGPLGLCNKSIIVKKKLEQ